MLFLARSTDRQLGGLVSFLVSFRLPEVLVQAVGDVSPQAFAETLPRQVPEPATQGKADIR